MSEFIKILLSLSVSGALLLLLILGLKPLYKNKFSKRWQYYIWIVVALRFLLPFTPDTTIVGSLFEKFDTAAITNEIPTSPNVPVPADTGNSKAEPTQTNREITTAAMREPFNKYVCLFFIWSALALVLFVRKVTVYQGFIQYIKAGNKEVSDIKILNLLSDCEEKLNIKTRVELSCNPLIASPMLIGFFRPRIILPVGELEDKELSYIFVHELTHYKQRDMFYKWLIQIIVCVHWFNPFVYLLEKEVNKSCELSCDEKVLSVLDDKAKREYGDTLISFLKSSNLYKSSLASVTLTEGAEQLKERLGAIMKFRKKSKVVIAITAIFTVAVCVCFFVTGAYAAPSANSKEKNLMPDAVPNVENNKGYTYVQRGFYSDSYIIEMGWNLSDTISKEYTNSKEITLEDNSVIKVYFDENTVDYLNDSNAISAIGKLLYSLNNRDMQNYPTIETPLITNVTYVSENNLSILADEYFQNSSLTEFSAIFPVLDIELQKEYCQKIYDDNKIAFFSSIIPYMDRDLVMLYADKSDQDQKVNFFSVILGYVQSDDLNQYAEKYYEANNISYFTILVNYMTKEERQEWLKRAQTDKKTNFVAVLSE
ncbi:M56 family metallopeptidase [Acutalibacter intestini]|uniref:M56 family metallopeptidase n=1 Tax=Acutalibacter intestini TaxID=3093659 RepID=UPI002AC89EBB|nr:M56 family metallopeptidase [Acutalibacter sp. M00204]